MRLSGSGDRIDRTGTGLAIAVVFVATCVRVCGGAGVAGRARTRQLFVASPPPVRVPEPTSARNSDQPSQIVDLRAHRSDFGVAPVMPDRAGPPGSSRSSRRRSCSRLCTLLSSVRVGMPRSRRRARLLLQLRAHAHLRIGDVAVHLAKLVRQRDLSIAPRPESTHRS